VSDPLIPEKVALIDHAFRTCGIRSFGELGCAWGVDGGYGFHALEHHAITKAVQVDAHISDTMKARARAHPQLTQLQRFFGDPDLPGLVGDVDAIILYDVLLHQVKPDWDEVMRMYAPRTKHFIVYNQQWVKGPDTVRLLDLGKEEYFASVPAGSAGFTSYLGLFENLDQPIPNGPPGRVRRDHFGLWQWGITDADLIKLAQQLGFGLQYFANNGSAFGIANIENHSFVFSRRA
jgi:hypothetical protein